MKYARVAVFGPLVGGSRVYHDKYRTSVTQNIVQRLMDLLAYRDCVIEWGTKVVIRQAEADPSFVYALWVCISMCSGRKCRNIGYWSNPGRRWQKIAREAYHTKVIVWHSSDQDLHSHVREL